MRRLWMLAAFFLVQGLGAQRFVPHTLDTLWYYDEGDRTYYQAIFRVDTVTANFYFLSQVEEVDGVKLWGDLSLGRWGIAWENALYDFSGPAWTVQRFYPSSVPPAQVEVRLLGSDTLLLVGSNVTALGLGPASPGFRWFPGRVKDLGTLIAGVTLAPTQAPDASGAAVYAVDQGGVFFRIPMANLTTNRWNDTARVVAQDFLIYDVFSPDLPFQDTAVLAQGWSVQGTVPAWQEVLVEGVSRDVIRVQAGTRMTKALGVPLPRGAKAEVLVLPQAGDRFSVAWGNDLEIFSAGNVVYARVISDTVVLDTLETLRKALLAGFERLGDTVRVLKAGVEAARFVPSSLSPVDSVTIQVQQGSLLVDAVQATLPVTFLKGRPGATARVWLGTTAGLFLYDESAPQPWSQTAFTNRVDAIFTHDADPDLVFVISDGKLFRSRDGGATFVDVTPPNALSVEDLAFSPANSSALLIGTDQGLLLSMDQGDTWTAVATNLDNFGPAEWMHEVHSLLWNGDSTVALVNRMGVFYSTDGFDAFAEWNYSGVRPTFLDPDRLQALAHILEDSTFTVNGTPYSGMYAAMKAILGEPMDHDGDSRVAVVFPNMRYDLTSSSRVPMFESVNPGTWFRGRYANGFEVIQLDVAHRVGDVEVAVDYTLPEDRANLNDPRGFNAVIRMLAKFIAYTHNQDLPRWLAEGIARYGEYALLTGEGNPDTLVTDVGWVPNRGFTSYPAEWSMDPSEPLHYRETRYAFLQFLKDLNSSFSVRDLIGQSDPRGYMESVTGMGFEDLLATFVDSLVLGGIQMLPNVRPVNYYTVVRGTETEFHSDIPVLALGEDDLTVAPLSVAFGLYQSGTVDTLWVNGAAGDTVRFKIYHKTASGVVPVVDTVLQGDGDLTLPLQISLGAGEELWLAAIWADSAKGIRQPFGGSQIKLFTSPATSLPAPETLSYLVIQDPLVSNHILFRSVSSFPVFAESPDYAVHLITPEGLVVREIETDPFGIVDTSFQVISPVESPYMPGVKLFSFTSFLTERGKDIRVEGRDKFGRVVISYNEFLKPLILQPGQSLSAQVGNVVLTVPAGAVRQEAWILVREVDDPTALGDYLGTLGMTPRKVVQVGSASTDLALPAKILVKDVDEPVQVFRYTEHGWVEVQDVTWRGDGVTIETRNLGMFALVSGGTLPSALKISLASPVVPRGGNLSAIAALPEPHTLSVTLLDALGRRAYSVIRHLPAGYHRVNLPLGNLAPGVYFLRMNLGTTALEQRVMVVP